MAKKEEIKTTVTLSEMFKDDPWKDIKNSPLKDLKKNSISEQFKEHSLSDLRIAAFGGNKLAQEELKSLESSLKDSGIKLMPSQIFKSRNEINLESISAAIALSKAKEQKEVHHHHHKETVIEKYYIKEPEKNMFLTGFAWIANHIVGFCIGVAATVVGGYLVYHYGWN